MYIIPNLSDPIRQGDIFRYLPKSEILYDLDNFPYVVERTNAGDKERLWFDIAKKKEDITTSTKVKPVTGIVISQDCDATRCVNIGFCEILPFNEVEKNIAKQNEFYKTVTTQSRKNQKWYYLAEDTRLGFSLKMGVSFLSIFEVNRLFLEKNKEILRIGRLDDSVAYPHFRERIAEFFRRYPYNEWYPLNKEELSNYEISQKSPVDKYPWQE